MHRRNDRAVTIRVSEILKTKLHFNIIFTFFKREAYGWICFIVGYYTSTTELKRAKTTYTAVNTLLVSLHTD